MKSIFVQIGSCATVTDVISSSYIFVQRSNKLITKNLELNKSMRRIHH